MPAQAWDGRAQLECDTCSTVTDFKNTAKNWAIQQNLAQGSYRVVVVNPGSALVGKAGVTRNYEGETHTWTTFAVMRTRSVADMQQAWRVASPGYLVDIPANVAGSYTGSGQSQTVGTYIHGFFSGQTIGLDETAVTLFPDGSKAVYQLVDAASQTWSFVSGTGEDANNYPLDDTGQPVNLPPGGPVLTPPLPIQPISIPDPPRLKPVQVKQTIYDIDVQLWDLCSSVVCIIKDNT